MRYSYGETEVENKLNLQSNSSQDEIDRAIIRVFYEGLAAPSAADEMGGLWDAYVKLLPKYLQASAEKLRPVVISGTEPAPTQYYDVLRSTLILALPIFTHEHYFPEDDNRMRLRHFENMRLIKSEGKVTSITVGERGGSDEKEFGQFWVNEQAQDASNSNPLTKFDAYADSTQSVSKRKKAECGVEFIALFKKNILALLSDSILGPCLRASGLAPQQLISLLYEQQTGFLSSYFTNTNKPALFLKYGRMFSSLDEGFRVDDNISFEAALDSFCDNATYNLRLIIAPAISDKDKERRGRIMREALQFRGGNQEIRQLIAELDSTLYNANDSAHQYLADSYDLTQSFLGNSAVSASLLQAVNDTTQEDASSDYNMKIDEINFQAEELDNALLQRLFSQNIAYLRQIDAEPNSELYLEAVRGLCDAYTEEKNVSVPERERIRNSITAENSSLIEILESESLADESFLEQCKSIINSSTSSQFKEGERFFADALNIVAALWSHPDQLFSVDIFGDEAAAQTAKQAFDVLYAENSTTRLRITYEWVMQQDKAIVEKIKNYCVNNESALKKQVDQPGRRTTLRVFTSIFLQEVTKFGDISRMFNKGLVQLNSMAVCQNLRAFSEKMPAIFDAAESLESAVISVIKKLITTAVNDFKELFSDPQSFSLLSEKFKHDGSLNNVICHLISAQLAILFEETKFDSNEFYKIFFSKIYNQAIEFLASIPFSNDGSERDCYEQILQDVELRFQPLLNNTAFSGKEIDSAVEVSEGDKKALYDRLRVPQSEEGGAQVAIGSMLRNFATTGLENFIDPLRKICQWKSKLEKSLFVKIVSESCVNAGTPTQTESGGMMPSIFSSKCAIEILSLENDVIEKIIGAVIMDAAQNSRLSALENILPMLLGEAQNMADGSEKISSISKAILDKIREDWAADRLKRIWSGFFIVPLEGAAYSNNAEVLFKLADIFPKAETAVSDTGSNVTVDLKSRLGALKTNVYGEVAGKEAMLTILNNNQPSEVQLRLVAAIAEGEVKNRYNSYEGLSRKNSAQRLFEDLQCFSSVSTSADIQTAYNRFCIARGKPVSEQPVEDGAYQDRHANVAALADTLQRLAASTASNTDKKLLDLVRSLREEAASSVNVTPRPRDQIISSQNGASEEVLWARDPIHAASLTDNYEIQLSEELENAGSQLPKFFDDQRIKAYLLAELDKLGKFGAEPAIRVILERNIALHEKLQLIGAIAEGKSNRQGLLYSSAARTFYQALRYLNGVTGENATQKFTEFLKARNPRALQNVTTDIETHIQRCVLLRKAVASIPLNAFSKADQARVKDARQRCEQPLCETDGTYHSLFDVLDQLHWTEDFLAKEKSTLQTAAARAETASSVQESFATQFKRWISFYLTHPPQASGVHPIAEDVKWIGVHPSKVEFDTCYVAIQASGLINKEAFEDALASCCRNGKVYLEVARNPTMHSDSIVSSAEMSSPASLSELFQKNAAGEASEMAIISACPEEQLQALADALEHFKSVRRTTFFSGVSSSTEFKSVIDLIRTNQPTVTILTELKAVAEKCLGEQDESELGKAFKAIRDFFGASNEATEDTSLLADNKPISHGTMQLLIDSLNNRTKNKSVPLGQDQRGRSKLI